MNHVYRVVFNRSLGVYQCVSELAKSRGKSSGKSQVSTKLILAPLAVAMLGLSGTAIAADVVINDGQRTEYQDDVAINGSVLITGSGTVITAPNHQINFGANPDGQILVIDTDVFIKNKAAVEAGVSSTVGVSRFSRVTVDNASLNAPAIAIGGLVDGEVNVINNGELKATDKVILGYSPNTTGRLNVDTSGKVTTNNLIIADAADSVGNAVIDGTGSNLTAQNNTFVGDNGIGSLSVQNGGELTSNTLVVANDIGSSGSNVVVKGVGSNINVKDSFFIGTTEDGSLSINGAGAVTSDKISVGDLSKAKGTLSITDSNSVANVTSSLIVGREGSGIINITNNATLNSNNADLAQESSALGEVNLSNGGKWKNLDTIIVGVENIGTINMTGQQSQIETSDLLVGGVNGKGVVNIRDKSSLKVDRITQVGGFDQDSQNAIGELNIDNARVETLGMVVGASGKGTVDVKEGGILSVNDLITVGNESTGKGTINLDGGSKFFTSSIDSERLVIGREGKGIVNINNTYDVDDGAWSIGMEISEDTIIGDTTTGIGELNIDSALVDAGNLIVGNEGSGTLRVVNDGFLAVDNISRGVDSTLSDVYFDRADLTIGNDQPNLFANFTDKQPIKIGSNGLIFDVIDNDVTINPNAVLMGNVGAVDFEAVKGGFAKVGTGTLTMSANSKQWTGETLITEGILKLNGDYTMATNDTLGIALDIEDEGNLESYGQLVVNGNADISKGALKVYASEAIAGMSGSNEWKNIVSADSRTGEFVSVSDNSPLVSFYADYSDANAVHLKMGTAPVEPETPVVTPEPPVVTPEPPVVTPEPPVVTPEPPVVDTTFVESVNTQSQRNDVGIAYVLDKAIQDRVTNGDNVLADSLINSTINFNQAQLATATNQLQPLFMGATSRIITDANYAVTDAINEHSQTTPQRNLWAQLLGNDSSHDTENGITGYDSEGYGAIVGLDTPVNSDLNLGVAFSYIKSDADTDGTSLDQELTTKNWQVLGYGNYTVSEATALNFHAGLGNSDVEGERRMTILTDAIASSDYSVDTLQAGLGVDHRIGTQQRNVTPFAQVNYARAESDSYRETGAGVYNLNVDENTYESMRWTAGLRLSQALTPTLALTGQLAAAIENGDRRSDITASFISMPNDEFTTIGQEVGREIGIAGIGLSYTPTINTKLSVGYRGEWRDNYDSQGANISLQTTF
ncbi:autotransporter domain-containing protein [Psychrobacter sp. NG27]|uniref:autotransporter domain-containing protein n=1 Tax=Psychrobacter sp. NG27 TaxID=2781966 RepID=UPI0018DF5766|nr:autotransporter domain-containing protein [Psychrobacter sp. NG27]MBI0425806.1 autotransporter domain-containing protein [Psychrobacter sp. NG27]